MVLPLHFSACVLGSLRFVSARGSCLPGSGFKHSATALVLPPACYSRGLHRSACAPLRLPPILVLVLGYTACLPFLDARHLPAAPFYLPYLPGFTCGLHLHCLVHLPFLTCGPFWVYYLPGFAVFSAALFSPAPPLCQGSLPHLPACLLDNAFRSVTCVPGFLPAGCLPGFCTCRYACLPPAAPAALVLFYLPPFHIPARFLRFYCVHTQYRSADCSWLPVCSATACHRRLPLHTCLPACGLHLHLLPFCSWFSFHLFCSHRSAGFRAVFWFVAAFTAPFYPAARFCHLLPATCTTAAFCTCTFYSAFWVRRLRVPLAPPPPPPYRSFCHFLRFSTPPPSYFLRFLPTPPACCLHLVSATACNTTDTPCTCTYITVLFLYATVYAVHYHATAFYCVLCGSFLDFWSCRSPACWFHYLPAFAFCHHRFLLHLDAFYHHYTARFLRVLPAYYSACTWFLHARRHCACLRFSPATGRIPFCACCRRFYYRRRAGFSPLRVLVHWFGLPFLLRSTAYRSSLSTTPFYLYILPPFILLPPFVPCTYLHLLLPPAVLPFYLYLLSAFCLLLLLPFWIVPA